MRTAQPLQNYLLTYRRRQGYTQKQLAHLLGCSESQVYRYERGQVPDLETAFKLELFYHVPLQTLFAGLYADLKQKLTSPAQSPAQDAPSLVPSPPQLCRQRILALDPWTRGIGVAVLEGDQLLHCGVRWEVARPIAHEGSGRGRAAD